jgi:hypothetical protein
MTLPVVQNIALNDMIHVLLNNELEWLWKKGLQAYFEVLSWDD